MDKGTKKYNTYNASIVKALVEKYGFSTQYIRQCIRGERNSLSADKIRRDYKSMNTPSEKKVQEFLND